VTSSALEPVRTATSASSLTRRLSLLFAGVSLAILAAMGVFLHHALAQQLMLRDARDLNGKIELIRHTLGDVGSDASIRQSPHRWLDVVVGHLGLHLAIFNEERSLLLANSELKFPDSVLRSPAPERAQQAAVLEWTESDGTRYRAVTAWGKLGKVENARVLIAFALDLSDQQILLAEYRANIIGAILVGTLLATLLGTWVARQGLSPLQDVAAAAGRITASRLGERLDVGFAPKELQALASAYNAMLDRLQDSFARLSQFSSDIAHDLRTPIGNLLGEAQVALSRSRSAGEYRSVIESSVEECDRLSRMIERMLFLARVDDAELALHVENVDLATEFARICDYFEPLAQEKGVSIEADGKATAYADASLLRRAISNLVANAIHFTPSAGGAIILDSRHTPDGATAIRVSNPGPEIPQHERERIFDRFYRLERAREDSTSNSGLGLAIVKSIMQLHAGRVFVESASGRTTFTLVFPPQRHGSVDAA
jgi:two-component system heavy metal sensor histidine kinase CusS